MIVEYIVWLCCVAVSYTHLQIALGQLSVIWYFLAIHLVCVRGQIVLIFQPMAFNKKYYNQEKSHKFVIRLISHQLLYQHRKDYLFSKFKSNNKPLLPWTTRPNMKSRYLLTSHNFLTWLVYGVNQIPNLAYTLANITCLLYTSRCV